MMVAPLRTPLTLLEPARTPDLDQFRLNRRGNGFCRRFGVESDLSAIGCVRRRVGRDRGRLGAGDWLRGDWLGDG